MDSGDGPAASSPWNLRPEARVLAGRRVILCDCTLREGEQAVGVGFTLEEKLLLARRLDEAGVDQLQVGFPGMSAFDREVTARLASLGLGAKIEGIANLQRPDWQRQVEATASCGVDVLSTQFSVSPFRRDLDLDHPEALLEQVRDRVQFACQTGRFVSFSSPDGTRADPGLLMRVFAAAVDAGARRVRVNDSVGSISPAAFRLLVAEVKRTVPVPVGVHCHNDYGLAMASVAAALEAGAELVDVTVNGLGERAGNPALPEVALAVLDLYGGEVGFDVSRSVALATLVAEMTHKPVPPSTPVVGADVFTHTMESHVGEVLRNPRVFEPFPPERVGNRRRFPLGRFSGEEALRLALGAAGLPLERVDLSHLVSLVQEQARAEKGEIGRDRLAELAGAARQQGGEP